MGETTPSMDLSSFKRLTFDYDQNDDIAVIHIDGPRPALSEPVDDGWYLRIADRAVVGLELHGLKRTVLTTPFFAELFRPAIAELERFTNGSFDAQDIRAQATAIELPDTTRLALFLFGLAVSKYEALRSAEFEDAGRDLLGAQAS